MGGEGGGEDDQGHGECCPGQESSWMSTGNSSTGGFVGAGHQDGAAAAQQKGRIQG